MRPSGSQSDRRVRVGAAIISVLAAFVLGPAIAAASDEEGGFPSLAELILPSCHSIRVSPCGDFQEIVDELMAVLGEHRFRMKLDSECRMRPMGKAHDLALLRARRDTQCAFTLRHFNNQ